METLFILVAAAITLMALEVGEHERDHISRERQLIPVSPLTRVPDEVADTTATPER
jgi:hypothetical protein